MSVQLEPRDGHNAALEAHAHPADWVNPAPPARPYHLAVLGGGTAGLVCAIGAAGLGARVALIERGLLGGDCLNFGCVPSKAILASARAAAAVRDAAAFGVRAEGAVVDFAAVMERMRRLRAEIAPHDSAERCRRAGVDVYLGEARFVDAAQVEVGGQRIAFRKAVVCTGARAAVPPVPGLAEAGYLTNESVWSLVERPARLAVIGGGPIGCELAQAFGRLGSAVTLVERAPMLLPREEPAAAAIVARALERDGVALKLGAALQRVESAGRAKRLHFEEGAVEADAVLVALGRAPNVEGIGLEAAGVAFDTERGVHVDDALRTSNPRVYAAGDVCLEYRFTHAADAAARIVIRNALFPMLPKQRWSSQTVPWCTYTEPEIAHVGLSGAGARAKGIAIVTHALPLGGLDRMRLDGAGEGLFEVHTHPRNGRILGATLVSPHAGESIGTVALAIRQGLTLGALGALVQPYPTHAEAFRRAADQANRARLTPRAAWLLKLLLR